MAEVAGSNPAEPTFFCQMDARAMPDDEYQQDDHLHNKLHNIDKEAPEQNKDDDDQPSSFLEIGLRDYEHRTGKRRPKMHRWEPESDTISKPDPTATSADGLSTVARNPKTWKALPPIFRSRKPI